jgi:hypothetical protein
MLTAVLKDPDLESDSVGSVDPDSVPNLDPGRPTIPPKKTEGKNFIFSKI